MDRKIIVNQDHFKLNTEQLYTLLCKNIQGKKSIYSILSADHAGIQFSKDKKDYHILKEEIIAVLDQIRKTHEFSMKDLKKLELKKQAPVMTFLIAGDIVY
jgi:hypothetical protein